MEDTPAGKNASEEFIIPRIQKTEHPPQTLMIRCKSSPSASLQDAVSNRNTYKPTGKNTQWMLFQKKAFCPNMSIQLRNCKKKHQDLNLFSHSHHNCQDHLQVLHLILQWHAALVVINGKRHKITEQLGLEGTSGGRHCPTSCLRHDQPQSPIKLVGLMFSSMGGHSMTTPGNLCQYLIVFIMKTRSRLACIISS